MLAPASGVEVVRVTDEDEYFPPPRNIRDLQAAIEAASTALLGGSILDRPPMDDRSLGASDVLAALTSPDVLRQTSTVSVARHLAPGNLTVDAHVAG